MPLNQQYSPADLQRLYRSLRRIRRIEEEVARVYPSDKIKSPVHLSIGQEALAVGVIDLLTRTDIVAGSYRSHAAYLAKGGDLKAMIAEMYGKATGCAGGKGGSMHLVGPDVGVMGSSAVVATQIPNAVGAALAQKMKGTKNVVVVFFGDGASEEGVFHESLNFAALHKLPIMFVCENNGFAIHTPLERRWASDRLTERVATYGMPAEKIADGDVLKIHRRADEMISFMRLGGGPTFLELHAYRWREHVGPNEDFDAGYRHRSDAEQWMENDQVPRLGAMIDSGVKAAIDAEIEEEIVEAFAFAENSPPPAPEELYTNVYAN